MRKYPPDEDLSQPATPFKKMRSLFISAALLIIHLACPAKTLTIDLPDDFVVFYQSFRSAAKSPSNENLLPLMCFPFASRELSEIIDERTNRYSKRIFLKFPTLAKSYLVDSIGEVRTEIDSAEIGTVLYTDPQDFIEQNADPRHPKKLDAAYAKVFPHTKDSIKITSLSFEKKQGRWCWSGASYFGDPLDDIKRTQKARK